jgi:hypothetical protein
MSIPIVESVPVKRLKALLSLNLRIQAYRDGCTLKHPCQLT